MLNILVSVLAPSMRMLFSSATYLRLCSFKATVFAPLTRMLFHYRHLFMFVFFHVSVCSLLVPCMLKFYSIARGYEDIKQ